MFACTRLAQVRKWSGKKFFKVRESKGILFGFRENWHFEEKSGKIELIPLKAGRNIWGHCDLNNIFPSI